MKRLRYSTNLYCASHRKQHAVQGFEEINGTGAVPNSDIPSWVISDAAGKTSHAPAPSVDVNNRFTIPVNRGSVNDASSLNGEQTCESSHPHWHHT